MSRRRTTKPLSLAEWIARYERDTVEYVRFKVKPKAWKSLPAKDRDKTPICLVGGPRDRHWTTREHLDGMLRAAQEMRTWTEMAYYMATGRRVKNPHFYNGDDLDHDRGFEAYEWQPSEEPP